MGSPIRRVVARQVFDSRGRPTIEADIQLVSYSASGSISGYGSFGLVVRAVDPQNGYGLGHCAAVGIFSCGSNQGSQPELAAVIWLPQYPMSALRSTVFNPGKGVWHHYKATAKGTTITLNIDGLTVALNDNRYTAGGRVGLWSDDCQIDVKNFVVTAA